MDKACIRIGNKQYLEANDSRGATTLSHENVCCNSEQISFSFRGKSGKQIMLTCSDEQLASVIEDCERSEGEFLFSYENENGEYVAVTSSDVNAFLSDFSKDSITAKDFRTWRGSVVALTELSVIVDEMSKTARKRLIGEAVKAAAEALSNTPAVCRRSYIHSAILTAAEEGVLPNIMRSISDWQMRRAGLAKNEITLVKFLQYAEGERSDFVTPVNSRRSKEAA